MLNTMSHKEILTPQEREYRRLKAYLRKVERAVVLLERIEKLQQREAALRARIRALLA